MNPTLETILNLCATDPDLGIPCLVGPAQAKKTTKVIRWAESHGRTPIMVNPAQNEAEETAGYARVARNGHRNTVRSTFTLPAIFPDAFYDDLEAGGDGSKWTLVVDELDKPRQQQTAHLLTALSWERRIRGLKFPPKMNVVAIMNPPERPLLEALAARLLYVQYPSSTAEAVAEFRNTVVGPLAELVLTIPDVKLPTLPCTPGAMEKLKQWVSLPEFWSDGSEELQRTVVRGLMSRENAEAVLATLPSLINTLGIPAIQWAKTVPPTGLRVGIAKVLAKIDPQARVNALSVLWDRAAADPTGELAMAWNAFAQDADFLAAIPGWPPEDDKSGKKKKVA